MASNQDPDTGAAIGNAELLAKASAGTIAIMTLGFLYSAISTSIMLAHRTGAVMELAIGAVLRAFVLWLLLYLTLRAYRRPSLLMSLAALLYILGDLALNVHLYGTTDLISKYWTQVLGTALAVVGFYGTSQARAKFILNSDRTTMNPESKSFADSLERYLGSDAARASGAYAVRLLALQVLVGTTWGVLRRALGVPAHSSGFDADLLIRLILTFAVCVVVSVLVATKYRESYVAIVLPVAMLGGIGNWIVGGFSEGHYSLAVLAMSPLVYAAMLLAAGVIFGGYGKKRQVR